MPGGSLFPRSSYSKQIGPSAYINPYVQYVLDLQHVLHRDLFIACSQSQLRFFRFHEAVDVLPRSEVIFTLSICFTINGFMSH